MHIDYIPIIKKDNMIRLAKGENSQKILDSFNKRSRDILTEGYIKKQYKEFAQKNIENYLRHFSGFNKWTSRIDRYLLKGLLLKRKYSKKQLLAIQNYIGCEAHRELLLQGLVLYEKFKWKA